MKFPREHSIWIMIIAFGLLLFSVLAEAVEIKGFVNDEGNVITPDYESKIEGVLQGIYNSKTAEFAVVTISSLEGQDIESYALNLAQGKLGDQEKNNGLLLLISVEDRKYRFEVGRGLEPIFNDAKIGRIGRTFLVDNFKNADYGKGVYEASLAVSDELLGGNQSQAVNTVPKVRRQSSISSFFSLFILFIIISSIFGSVGKNKTYRKRDRFFDAAIMAGLLFGGRGRGGMGGFSGGGFSGFGGGGFGGGGAGGSF